MAKARKMVNLSIEETSGVDHPAHLTEGWLVMKSADESDVQRVLDESLNREDSPMEETVKEQTEETPKDEATVEASAETVVETPVEAVVAEVEASSDEEMIAKVQLARMKEISMDRELTLEEAKRVEIFTKILLFLILAFFISRNLTLISINFFIIEFFLPWQILRDCLRLID